MTEHPLVVVTALILITILFVGFLAHISAMAFGKKPADIKAGEINIWLVIPPLLLITIVIGLSFYLPPFLRTLIETAVLHYS